MGASAQSVDLTCDFQDTNFGYSCVVSEANIQDDRVTVNFIGIHTNSRNNNDVIFVQLAGTILTFIPNTIFSTFPNVEVLDMDFCGILNISENSFQGATNLRIFSAFLNRISALPARTFVQAPNLKEIDLHFNEIVQINSQAFVGLTSLDLLDLDLNRITALQLGTFDDLQSLEVLRLSFNSLREVNSAVFRGLAKLYILNLSFGTIASITPFPHLPGLLLLQLNSNNIDNFKDGTFDGLSEIIYLLLERNQIETISGRIFASNRNLLEVDLGHNRINAIQSTFIDNLKQLATLRLTDNFCVSQNFLSIDRAVLEILLANCFNNYVIKSEFNLRMDGELLVSEI